MKRIGLIGLGVISKKYKLGLQNNNVFELVCVCDKNEDKYGLSDYTQYRFYSDYKDMIAKEGLDYVLVATGPESHENIIISALELGVNVLSEKPFTPSLSSLKKIFKLANEKKLVVDCIFHWAYASEAIFIYNYLKDKTITNMDTYINDDYASTNNTIKQDRVALLGTWFDSGINVISFIANLVDLDVLTCEEKSYVIDDTCNMSYISKHVFKSDDMRVSINIDWSKDLNKKITYIKTIDEKIVVDHSKQLVTSNEKVIFNGNQHDRLSTHYLNYFSNFDGNVNHENIKKAHKFLFEYNYKTEK